MDRRRASIEQSTRDAIRYAFYRRDILNTDKQYAWAIEHGFDLSPAPSGGTTLPSFLNLSEEEGQRLLALLGGPG